MQNQHVIVVGGGIVGCLTALALVKHGCQVTVVERNQIAAQTSGESSWAGAGILFPLLPWDYRDEVNDLALRGASLYPQMCDELNRSLHRGIPRQQRKQNARTRPAGFTRGLCGNKVPLNHRNLAAMFS